MKRLIYKLLRYFNYLLILGLLVAYTSVYINPEKSWVFAFFGLAFPFILLANCLFVIFWIIKKKKFFLVPLIAILIGWNYAASIIQVKFKSNQKGTVQNTFSILTYNVRVFDLYDWNKEENTSEKIFEYINQENPDIICFQEFYTRANGKISEESIQSFLSGKYQKHISYNIDNKTSNYGIATYSKYPIINKGAIHFEESINSTIYTDVVINSDTIRILNCHLQSIRFNPNNYSFISNSKELDDEERIEEIKDISFRLRDAFVKRAGQAKIIAEHIKNSPYKVMVCGDFNDVPVSYTYRTIRQDLKDSFKEAGMGIGNTYVGNFPSFRIDYILHDKSIRSIDYKVENIELSDHYPVKGVFLIEN